MPEHEHRLFENRISEEAVARILYLIASLPNRRETRLPEDTAGDFDYWFDGGACKVETGVKHFVFQDGTRAELTTPVPRLSLSVQFPGGHTVSVLQKS